MNDPSAKTRGGEILQVHPYCLMFFTDETGHEDFADPNFPIFGMGGCGLLAAAIDQNLRQPWREMKANHFGGADVTARERTPKADRRTDRGIRSVLRGPAVRKVCRNDDQEDVVGWPFTDSGNAGAASPKVAGTRWALPASPGRKLRSCMKRLTVVISCWKPISENRRPRSTVKKLKSTMALCPKATRRLK